MVQLTGLNRCNNGPLLQYKPVQYILKLIVLPYHFVANGLLTIFNVCLLLSFMMCAYFIVCCQTVFLCVA